MGYTAIDKLQKNNFDTFGIDLGPKQPEAHYPADVKSQPKRQPKTLFTGKA